MSETTATQQWICESCGFIYDPEEGDPDGGVPAGTAFDDIPADWVCPVCGARKKDFAPYEGWMGLAGCHALGGMATGGGAALRFAAAA